MYPGAYTSGLRPECEDGEILWGRQLGGQLCHTLSLAVEAPPFGSGWEFGLLYVWLGLSSAVLTLCQAPPAGILLPVRCVASYTGWM